MIGAIAGDIIGSPYEGFPIKTKDFPLFGLTSRFTDDTVLTIAIADAIVSGRSYFEAVRSHSLRYPRAGYGGGFREWIHATNPAPYNSWGNGSAMRVSPVGFAFNDESTVLIEAERSAAITHNHPEGVKGAQATALAIFMARTGSDKNQIRDAIAERFHYDMNRTVDGIRLGYAFDISCQGTVPEALIAFLDSTSYEGAVRNAVSLGGDSDTLACIAGGIAQAFYGGVPEEIESQARRRLPADLAAVLDSFSRLHQRPETRGDGNTRGSGSPNRIDDPS
jgi:ADP-ribosylglycohydrolase